MKIPRLNQFTLALVAVLAVLQFSLWIGEGSIFHLFYMLYQAHEVNVQNDALRKDNDILYTEVLTLKNSGAEIESRARYQLGFTKSDELYYQILNQ